MEEKVHGVGRRAVVCLFNLDPGAGQLAMQPARSALFAAQSTVWVALTDFMMRHSNPDCACFSMAH